MIKVIENLNIDHNGNIYTPESIGYHSLYCKFIQKNIPFKIGSVIEEKTVDNIEHQTERDCSCTYKKSTLKWFERLKKVWILRIIL